MTYLDRVTTIVRPNGAKLFVLTRNKSRRVHRQAVARFIKRRKQHPNLKGESRRRWKRSSEVERAPSVSEVAATFDKMPLTT